MLSFKATALATAATVLATATSSASAAGVYVFINCWGGDKSSEIWYYPDRNNFNYMVDSGAKYHVRTGGWCQWEGVSQFAKKDGWRTVFTSIHADGHAQGTWQPAGSMFAALRML